jgi:hypothetical protein
MNCEGEQYETDNNGVSGVTSRKMRVGSQEKGKNHERTLCNVVHMDYFS